MAFRRFDGTVFTNNIAIDEVAKIEKEYVSDSSINNAYIKDKLVTDAPIQLQNSSTYIDPSTLREGSIFYNSTTKKPMIWNGDQWVDLYTSLQFSQQTNEWSFDNNNYNISYTGGDVIIQDGFDLSGAFSLPRQVIYPLLLQDFSFNGIDYNTSIGNITGSISKNNENNQYYKQVFLQEFIKYPQTLHYVTPKTTHYKFNMSSEIDPSSVPIEFGADTLLIPDISFDIQTPTSNVDASNEISTIDMSYIQTHNHCSNISFHRGINFLMNKVRIYFVLGNFNNDYATFDFSWNNYKNITATKSTGGTDTTVVEGDTKTHTYIDGATYYTNTSDSNPKEFYYELSFDSAITIGEFFSNTYFKFGRAVSNSGHLSEDAFKFYRMYFVFNVTNTKPHDVKLSVGTPNMQDILAKAHIYTDVSYLPTMLLQQDLSGLGEYGKTPSEPTLVIQSTNSEYPIIDINQKDISNNPTNLHIGTNSNISWITRDTSVTDSNAAITIDSGLREDSAINFVGINTNYPKHNLDISGDAFISQRLTANSGTASGQNSVALGVDTLASGDYSVAMGRGTIASSESGTVIGKYNSTKDELFVVGNGTDELNKNDAFIISNDGNTIIGNNLNVNGEFTQII